MNEPIFSVKEFLTLGWEGYKKNSTLLLFVTITALGVALFTNLVSSGLEKAHLLPAYILFGIISVLVNLFFRVGTTVVILNVCREQFTSYSDLFKGGKWFLRCLGFEILMYGAFFVLFLPLYLILSLLVFQQGNTFIPVVVIISIILLPAFIYTIIRLVFCEYYIIDRDNGIFEAIKNSWELSKSNTFNIFLFLLAAFFINIMGLVLCGVGLLLTFPPTLLATAYMYMMLSDYREPREITAGEPVNDVIRP